MVTPIALGLARVGLTPNALTVIGFLIACVAAVAAGAQAWLLAGFLVIFGGVFDLFDGAVARATGKVSKLGAFLDSTFDRWGEGVVFVGIAWGALDMGLSRPVLLATLAMVSAFMVSYTRAKAENMGFTSGGGMAAVGLAPREVRLVILTLGLIAAGLLPGFPADMDTPGAMAYPLSALALELSLGLIAVLATITTIQRIIHTVRQAAGQQQG
jgi:CDP-diacylglycerol--glycerol-3-phosphate 3-phosphatidyltransferase